MKLWLVGIVSALIFAFFSSPVLAQSFRDAEYKAASDQGVDHVFRLEHDTAIQFFAELALERPDHPGPPLAGAVAVWLRELFARQELDLNNFISPGYFTRASKRAMPAVDRQAFFDGIAKSQELAAKYLTDHPGDKDARYYLGACEGALGAFALTIDRSYMKALRHGKKAYQYQVDLVDEDPEFWDSYMTVGTYEYVLGNIPWYLKWIATIAGYRGSEERGFEYLVIAADKGVFVSNESRVLLMVLYVREKSYDYALQVVGHLRKRYPENFLLHLNQAQILERMRERERAIETYLEVVRLAEEGRKNYQKVPLGTFRYTAGTRLVELGEKERALELFLSATNDPATPQREKALSHLRAGELLDLLGQRQEAISQYEEVQELPQVENSHQTADKYLKSPYDK
jgi:tetratricopeptide (TPR) repeat protein